MKRLVIFFLFTNLVYSLFSQPMFSHEHGLYENTSFDVLINSNKGYEIRYTLDGSEPTSESLQYNCPLSISTTTILRAAEFYKGEIVSPIKTASYLFMDSILSQSNTPKGYPDKWGKYTDLSLEGYAIADYEMDQDLISNQTIKTNIIKGFKDIPIISLVTDIGNLFNHENDSIKGGIYIYTGAPVGDRTGRGWIRPASFELFGKSAGKDNPKVYDLTYDCGIKLHGGHSRLAEKNPKHSFRLVFKKEYGSGKLNYPIFDSDNTSPIEQLTLRCHFNNSWPFWEKEECVNAQYTRDVWARMTQKRLGRPYSEALYVHLFINGIYWGLYNIAERVDDQYCINHFGGKKSDYDVIKMEETGEIHLDATEGSLNSWEELIRLSIDAANEDIFYKLQGLNPKGEKESTMNPLLDIDNFIDFMLLNQYGGNTDWDHHNWYAIKKNGVDGFGFIFVAWDSEKIFGDIDDNVLNVNNKDCPSEIFNKLMKSDLFARKYLKRAEELLKENGLLSNPKVVELWDSLYFTVANAVYCESARWGDYRRDVHNYSTQGDLYTVDFHYMNERNRLLYKYFPYRSNIVLNQIYEYINAKKGRDFMSGIKRIVKQNVDNDCFYNLYGQKINNPKKGVFIMNHKKIVR